MKPFPGKPQAQLQAVSTALWDGKRIVAYIAGNALIILGGPNDLIQTINHGEDDQFTAVAIHDITGKIAASTEKSIVIYKPFGHDFGAPKWSFEYSFACEAQETSIYSLSWGFAEELLAGGSALTLFSTGENGRRLWTRSIANPVKFAALSPDGSFIATSGWHDRLVKIWRRLYFSEENERFDVSYLPHTSAVTELRWHGRRDPEYHAEAILYTTSADCKLKVWAATDPHGLQALQLWAEMDLTRCMLPEIERKEEHMRRKYLFIVDNWEYEALVERVTHRSSNTEKDQETLKKLVDVAYRDPDICVVLDDQGNMSAWGLERVGCKARQANDVFKVAQMTDVDVNALADVEKFEDYATCLSFGGLGDGCEVNLLINFFDGRLQWLTCPIDRLFYAEPGSASFTTEAVFTGHTEVIEGLATDASKSAVMSRSAASEVVLWNLREGSASSGLQRVGYISSSTSVKIAVPLANGQYALTVDEREVSLWDTRRSKAVQLSSQRLPAHFEVVDFLMRNDNATKKACEVLLLSDSLGGILFTLSADSEGRLEYVERVCDVKSIQKNTSELFSLVSTSGIDGEGCAVSVDKAGRLVSWTLDVTADRESAAWKKMSTLETGIQNSIALSVNVDMKTVLLNANRTLVTIWDVRDGNIEFAEQFQEHNTINHIRWTAASDGNPVLALVFNHKVLFYAQLPYELHGQGSPDVWLRLREIDINELTNLPISDLAWLAGRELVLSAGNQMFTYGKEVDRETAHGLGLPSAAKNGHELFKVVSAMNCTLPMFHPQSLRQLSLSGRTEAMQQILGSLHIALKYFSEGDKLDSSLGFDFGQTSPDINSRYPDDDDEDKTLTEGNATELVERLSRLRLPHLPTLQRDELIRIVNSVGANQKQQRSVDLYGYRYLLMSYEHFSHIENADSKLNTQLSWREIVLAYHSTSQEILIDMTSRHYKGRLLWKDARECGMFMWTKDIVTLRLQFENIARNEYTKTDERNPIDCSLHYIALRKKTVLISLWRMATWNKEQSATQRLLTNNFADPKWQTTALKNAYALLGRRRFEYAATFFLLADRPKDAASVLSTQMNDIQLAVAVIRVYEGDDGPGLKELIKDKVLPLAAQQGDRWLAHWAFDMLGRRDLAMRCLVVPLTTIVNVKLTSAQVQQAAHFRNSDPALLSLYRQLRDTIVPPGQQSYPALGAVEEWDFVMKTVRTYVRAGCAALALDIARTWKFATQTSSPQPRSNGVSTAASTASTPQEGLTPKPSALDAFRNGPRQQTTTLSEPPSMLDLFTMASPAMPHARPRPNPPTTSRTAQQAPSMLEDYFSDNSTSEQQPRQAAPKPSMRDAFTDPQRAIPQRHSTPQPPPAPSMLDAFMEPAPAAKKPSQPSMLDAFMAPVPTVRKAAQQASQPLSMLDAFGDPTPAVKKSPQQGSQPPSMLDAFIEPTSAPKKTQPASMLDTFMDPEPSAVEAPTPPKQPPSILDAFTDPQPATNGKSSTAGSPSAATNATADSVAEGDTTNIEEEKSAADNDDKVPGFGGKIQRKKVEKEPDANSILDNFNF